MQVKVTNLLTEWAEPVSLWDGKQWGTKASSVISSITLVAQKNLWENDDIKVFHVCHIRHIEIFTPEISQVCNLTSVAIFVKMIRMIRMINNIKHSEKTTNGKGIKNVRKFKNHNFTLST